MAEALVTYFDSFFGDGGGVFGFTLILGLLFGFLGERSGFCLRAAVEEWVVDGEPTELFRESSRTAQYMTAMMVAIVSVQALLYFEVVDLSSSVHRTANFTWLGMIIGGLLFGAGMVLAGGCVSRLTILAARGNLRSWWTLIVLSIAAWATLGGLLSPIRLFLEGLATTGAPSPSADGGMLLTLVASLLASLVVFALLVKFSKAYKRDFVYGGLVGLLVPFGWLITALWAADPFSDLPVVSMAFTRPIVDGLQLVTISSGVDWNFGMGLVIGTLVGAFVSAALAGRLYIDGFRSEASPLRYGAGAVLMGFGGILGLGCSMGQGLTGVSTLSSGSLLVFVAIIVGAAVTFKLRR